MLRKRPDWSRKLPRPIVIPDIMTMTTLADVRELVDRLLPDGHRKRQTWQHVARCLAAAALGGEIEDCAASLRLALSIERVPVE